MNVVIATLLALAAVPVWADGNAQWTLAGMKNACLEGAHNALCPKKHTQDRSWHVLVITQGGAVSLIKDLTKEEAEHTAAKLKGQPYTPEEKAEAAKQAAHEAAELAKCKADEKKQSQGSQGMWVFTCGSSMIWATQASDVRSVEVFQ